MIKRISSFLVYLLACLLVATGSLAGEPPVPLPEGLILGEKQFQKHPEAPSLGKTEAPVKKSKPPVVDVSTMKEPENVRLELKRFGYDLFAQEPSAFAPGQHVPVGPDYVVGPGDSIKIDIWGKIEGNWNAVVDNDGNISIPKIGVFGVTGLTYEQLKELLHKKLSKYYTGFDMNVSMGSLRTMRIYIVGNAQRPGAYTVSSLSTVIGGLLEGGGPSLTGSMRDIQVKRNGNTVTNFDLYDFLLKGDKTNDVRLMPEDVIFIPPVGPLAGISGNVNTPAIYELKGETRLLDLIRMAGGLTGNAFKGRIQVQRVQDHAYRTLFEGDLIGIESSPHKNFTLQNGDTARIFAVVDAPETITIAGAVSYPGEFAIRAGTTRLKDVVELAGGMLYYASNQAEITRLTASQEGARTEVIPVDLVAALQGAPEGNLILQRDDYLLVRAVPEWNPPRTVTVKGEVRFPGTYVLKGGETLASVLERAGGFTDRAYPRGAVFTREKVRRQQQRQIDEMAERLERELFAAGTAQVATASSADDARIVQMELEQKKHFIAQLKGAKAKGRIALNIAEPDMLRNSTHDIEMEESDSLYVPSNPNTVQVIGSVYNQNAFVYEPTEGHEHYIDLAGGFTSTADKCKVYILQANGTATKAGGNMLGFGDRLHPGDTIVVPESVDRVAWMRNLKDITQILFQVAVAAGVAIATF